MTADTKEDSQDPLTPTAAAILGLLAQRPWTTYELARQMQRSVRWFWKRAERKLYNEPKRLVARGYATSQVGATGNRRRTVYSITPAGRSALSAWLDTEGEPPLFESENLLRVFFAEAGTADQLRATIARMGAQARGQRQALLDIAATRDIEDPMVAQREPVNALSIRLVLDLHSAIEDWAVWASSITADWASTDRPPWTGEEVFGLPPTRNP